MRSVGKKALIPYASSIFPDERITKTRLFKYIEDFTSKIWKFSEKKNDIFHISAQARHGGSNEYPQSMFLSINKKK